MTSVVPPARLGDTPQPNARAMLRPATPWLYLSATAVVLKIALIWTHEPWVDELQAVLLARDSNTAADWWSNFRYEGHAPLWHLLLKLFLQFGFSEVSALRVAATFCAGITSWLVLVRVPLAPAWRLALALNYLLLFEYGVIARDYSLGVVLFFAAIAFRRTCAFWVLVALLPQAGLQFVLLAGICVWIAFQERRWSWSGVALCVAGVALALAWIRPAPGFEATGRMIMEWPIAWRVALTLTRAGAVILPIDWNANLIAWMQNWPALFTPILFFGGIVLPLLAYAATYRTLRLGLVISGFVVATELLSIHTYVLSVRHFGLVLLPVVAALWIEGERGLAPNKVAQIWLCALAVAGCVAAARMTTSPFASSFATQKQIEALRAFYPLIIPLDPILGTEVSALNHLLTYDLNNSCLQTFTRFKGPVLLPLLAPDQIGSPAAVEAIAIPALARIKAAAAAAGGAALVIADSRVASILDQVPDPDLRKLVVLDLGAGRGVTQRTFIAVHVPAAAAPTHFRACAF